MIIDQHNWRLFARCAQEVRAGRADPAWWDSRLDTPDDEPSETKEQRAARHAKAKAVCQGCPLEVQAFCLAQVKPGVDEGVRVGLVLTEIPAGQAGNRRSLSLSA
jgi:hypothetical protein